MPGPHLVRFRIPILLLGLAASAASARAATNSPEGAPPPEFERATRLLAQGDTDGAVRQYEAFLARAPGDPMAPVGGMAIGNLRLAAQGDTAAALSWFERVARDYPASPLAGVAASRRAEQFAARRDWAAAGGAWLDAMRLLPPDLASRMRRAELATTAFDCLERAGRPDLLAAACRGILAGTPTPELAGATLWRLGNTLESAGKPDSAATCYARLIRSYPSAAEFGRTMAKRPLIERHVTLDWDPYALYNGGYASLLRSDYEAGLANADSLLAMTTDPALVECGEYRKLTCETWIGGDLVGGMQRLRAFLAKYPDGLRAATATQTLNERWQPMADMQQGALDAPDDPQAHLAMGDTFVRARIFRAGVVALEKAATLAPDDPTTIFALGHGYAVSGHPEDAVRTFDRCLALQPDDTGTMNLAGYALLGAGHATAALPYFERYATLAPEDPNAHDSYGEGLLAVGRAADSAREYEKALQLRPDLDNAAFMLGRASREAGDRVAARRAFARYLELKPNGDRAADARAALAEMDGEVKP